MAMGLRQNVEEEIARRHAEGDLTGAATLGYETYGPEILAFLEHELRDPDLAMDAFSQLGVDIWRGLPGFRFASSFRTWAYRLARNAMYRLRKDPYAKRAYRALPGEISRVQLDARSRTAPWRRTSARDQLTLIREELSPEERAILTLRLDRGMAWNDVALVLADEDESLSDADIKKRSAALRQRYKGIKRKLKERFAQAGLLGERD